jgi:hypothetical protein
MIGRLTFPQLWTVWFLGPSELDVGNAVEEVEWEGWGDWVLTVVVAG